MCGEIFASDAEEAFTTRAPDKIWNEMNRGLEGWSGVFIDENLIREDKNVKIVRVLRRNQDGTLIDNYFYCSNKAWINPHLVEWCRHYRWKEENGFNAWTNQWHLLKHVFTGAAAACDAMIGFIFIAIISVVNYQHGNLKRAGRKFKMTLKCFFHKVYAGFLEYKQMSKGMWRYYFDFFS